MLINHFLLFSEPENSNAQLKAIKKASLLSGFNLLDQSFNVFNYLSRDFTISTNNGSYKFNSEMLRDTSSVIYNQLTANPTSLEYHLDVDDSNNVMVKIEQLYQGKKATFDNSELLFVKIISEKLKINSLPAFMTNLRISRHTHMPKPKNYNVILNNHSLISFLQHMPQEFTININDKKYQCNILGVRSSKKIRELIDKDPNINNFAYDVDDEYDNFQIICDLFNFQKIEITNNNMESLKQFSDDLQIECIIEKVDNFINTYENAVQTIDDKQLAVEEIDHIFDLLYNRSNKPIEFVKESIIQSKWVKTYEEVQELSACILQLIKCSFVYHQYVYDLIILLDNEFQEHAHLKNLIPTIIDNLMRSFSQNKLESAFTYRLYKNGFITKEAVLKKFERCLSDPDDDCEDSSPEGSKEKQKKISILFSWFLPEILDSESFKYESIITSCSPVYQDFINRYYPDKMDEYKKMRDIGKPDDSLTQALIHDDLDSLQKIVSQFDFKEQTVPFNIYNYYIKNGKTSFINYAAAHGSVRCFKYLLLNDAVIDKYSLQYAVFGENYEIIRTVDQLYSQEGFQIDYSISTKNSKSDMALNPILPAILKHNNELFDWTLQEKFINKGQTGNKLKSLLVQSSMHGNAHSFISYIDNGLDLNTISNPTLCHSIGEASRFGFYKYIQLVFNFITKQPSLVKKNLKSSIFFGNLLIFKLILNYYNKMNFDEPLLVAINQGHLNIIKYIVEECFNEGIKLTSTGLLNCLKEAIQQKSEAFQYLINKLDFDNIKEQFTIDADTFISILDEGCNADSFENVKFFTNIILEKFLNSFFTQPFIIAIDKKHTEISKFFIDINIPINLMSIAKRAKEISSIDEQTFHQLIKKADNETKQLLFANLLYPAIQSRNVKIVDYILSQKIPYDFALFEAVKSHDIETVKIVLKYNSKPSFINQLSEVGTALNCAICQSDLDIVKFLLTVPGIDPSLYDCKNNTPLITAITCMNLTIINLLLDYYGEKIQSQKIQLNLALQKLLEILSDELNVNNLFDNNNKIIDHKVASDVIKRLIEIEDLDLNCHTKNYTLLSYACEINDIELVKMLIDSNKVDVNSYTLDKAYTPLMVAILSSNLEIAKLLIDSPKTNINQKTRGRETALTIAVERHLPSIIRALINHEKFDPDESFLDFAFYISRGQASRQLLSAKALDVNYTLINFSFVDNEKVYDVSTTLINAVEKDDIMKIEMIVNHPSFDPSKSQVKSAIFKSVSTKNIEAFRVLLPLINNDVNICYSESNESLLSTAVQSNNLDVVNEILNDANFDSKKSDILSAFILTVSKRKKAQNTLVFAFYDAMDPICNYDSNHDHLIDFSKLLPNGKSFFTAICSNFSNIYDVVTFFLNHGVSPEQPDRNGFTPLYHAIGLESVHFVRLLVRTRNIDFSRKFQFTVKEPVAVSSPTKQKNAKSNSLTLKCRSQRRFDVTYLHLAASAKNMKIFKEIIDLNAIDINSSDDQGETPLFYAARSRNGSSVQQLFLRENLDFAHKNNAGMDVIKCVKIILQNNNIGVDHDVDAHINTKGEYLSELMSLINLYDTYRH